MKETAADGIGIHYGGDSTVNTVHAACSLFSFSFVRCVRFRTGDLGIQKRLRIFFSDCIGQDRVLSHWTAI